MKKQLAIISLGFIAILPTLSALERPASETASLNLPAATACVVGGALAFYGLYRE